MTIYRSRRLFKVGDRVKATKAFHSDWLGSAADINIGDVLTVTSNREGEVIINGAKEVSHGGWLINNNNVFQHFILMPEDINDISEFGDLFYQGDTHA